MAEELKARLSVDTAEFKSGMAGAAATVEDFNARAKAAQDAYNAKAKEGAEVSARLGAAFDAAGASGASFVEAMEQAVAAVGELSAAETQETAVLQQNISSRMAGGVVLRELTGNFASLNRGAASYLSTLPVINTAMQGAFAVAGPVAVLAVVVEIVGALGHVVSAYHDVQIASRQASDQQILDGEKVIKAKASFFSASTVASVINGNGFGQGSVDVQSAEAKLKELEAQKQILAARAQDNEAGLTGLALQKQRATDAKAELDLAKQQKAAADGLVESYRQQLEATHTTFVLRHNGPFFGPQEKQVLNITDSGQVKAIQEQMRRAKEASDALGTSIEVLGLHYDAVQKKEPLAAGKDDDKASRERLKAMEEDLAKRELNGKMSAKAIYDFWTANQAAFTDGSEQYLQVLEKRVALAKAGEERASRAIAEAKAGNTTGAMDTLTGSKAPQVDEGAEALAKGREAVAAWAKVTSEDVARVGERWQQYRSELARGAEIQAGMTNAIERVAVATDLADGKITRITADHRLAAADAAEYTVKLQALREELKRLQDEGAKLHPGDKDYEKNATQQAGVQNQISQVSGQQNVATQKNAAQLTSDIAKPYLDAYAQIESGLMKVQAQMLSGQKSFAQGMKLQVGDWTMYAIEQGEKWLFKQGANEVLSIAKHVAATQIKKGADATAAAEKVSIDTSAAAATQTVVIAQNVAEILSLAAVASAAAFASTAAIPVVGLVAAPVAAATAYTAVAAMAGLASFDVGTNWVPKTGIAMIHEGERIVPRADNEALLRGAGQQGSGHTFNTPMENHFHSSSGAEPKQLAKAVQKAHLRSLALAR